MKKLNILFTLLTITLGLSSQVYASEIANYIKPINSESIDVDRTYSVASKEYWFETSGAQLMKGVELNNTSPRVLMLVSTSGTAINNNVNSAIKTNFDTGLLKLVSASGKTVNSKNVSESQLAQTGFFSNSAAVFTDKNTPDFGPLRLTTTQQLDPNAKFFIMVREPDSDYILNLSTSSQNVDADRKILATIQMNTPIKGSYSRTPLKPTQYSATLVGVDGSRVALETQYRLGRLIILRPQMTKVIAPINGLYELVVEAKGFENKMAFHRKAKLPFAFSEATAKIVSHDMSINDAADAQVEVQVNTYSRFEVRAVLYGTNSSGKLMPIMESQVAQELNQGAVKFAMNFDPKLIAESGLSAPFKLDHIKLFDQHQMALLEEQQTSTQLKLPIFKQKLR